MSPCIPLHYSSANVGRSTQGLTQTDEVGWPSHASFVHLKEERTGYDFLLLQQMKTPKTSFLLPYVAAEWAMPKL
jgi:hypothetical protein